MRVSLKRTIMAVAAAALFATGSAFASQPDKQMSNGQIVAEIQDKLYHAKISKHGEVAVTFNRGVATLSGKVDSIGVKQDAQEAAKKVADVASVVDNITVSVEQSTPGQILEQARKLIVMYPFYTIFDHVALEATAGNLTASGQVTDPFEKDAIGDFLSHIQGVASLNNNLEVLPVSLQDNHLRRSVARAIYRDPFFVYYANQPMPPIHVIVKNGHVTLEGVVGSEIDRRIAANNAAFAGTYFSLTNNLRVDR
jgi:hyperosmotically inducible periplasmic protein